MTVNTHIFFFGLSEEATNTDFIVFRFIWSRLEPTIYHIRGQHTKHYTTNAVRQVWLISLFPMTSLHEILGFHLWSQIMQCFCEFLTFLVFYWNLTVFLHFFLCITCCKKIRRNSDPVLDNYTENMTLYWTARSTKYDSLLWHTYTHHLKSPNAWGHTYFWGLWDAPAINQMSWDPNSSHFDI